RAARGAPNRLEPGGRPRSRRAAGVTPPLDVADRHGDRRHEGAYRNEAIHLEAVALRGPAGDTGRAMSQENVEVVERALEEFIATGQFSDEIAADVIWDVSTFRGWPEQPFFHGFDGFTLFFDAWREPYDDWSMAVEQIL